MSKPIAFSLLVLATQVIRSPVVAAVPSPVVGPVSVNDANTLPGDLVIGDASQAGDLTIGVGGSIGNFYGYVGADPLVGGNRATIQSGGAWTNLGDLYVGALGASNSMFISSGGSVAVGGVTYVGWDASAQRASVFMNAGTWTNSGDIYLGRFGSNSQISITNGGVASFAANVFVASESGVDSHSIFVAGAGSRMEISADFYLGLAGGGGDLVVSNGGVVSSFNAYVGLGVDSASNSVLLRGAGSSWTNSGRITIAAAGQGVVTASDGASLSADEIVLAEVAGSRGTLNVGRFGESDDGGYVNAVSISFGAGDGVLQFNQSASRTISADISGAGVVKQLGSGRTILSGSNSYTGGTRVENGLLQSGSVNALGTGLVELVGGSLAPVGTLTIESLHWTGGSVATTVGVATSLLGINGDLTLDPAGGIFLFSEGAGFASDTAYTILNASNLAALGSAGFSGNVISSLSPVFGLSGNSLTVTFVGGASTGPILQNAAPTFTPVTADFFVNGAVTTADSTQNNTVNSLRFSGGSSLRVYNRLQVTSGNFEAPSGISSVSGGELFVPGTFTKLGDGVLNILSAVSVTGGAVLAEGSTLVNGSFVAGGPMSVLPGALLGGSGTIVADVRNSGAVAPGSSIGTLTINGGYSQTSSGSLVIEVGGPSSFDKLAVLGPAELGGALEILSSGGYSLQFGDKYQFLSAGGGISGEFDTIAMPPGFRGRFLTGGSNTQGTLLVAPRSYTQMAVTQNQLYVASALDAFIPASSGDRETVSTALDTLAAAQYPAAFEQMMPSQYASLPSMAFNVANALNSAMFQRLWMQRVNGRGFSTAGIDMHPMQAEMGGADDMGAFALNPTRETNWGTFVDGNGVFANAASTGSVQNYRSQSGGVTTGASYLWNDNFATGVYVGYQGLQAEYNSGRTIDNAVRFGVFGTYEIGDFYFNGLVGGAYHGYTVNRNIDFEGLNRTATGRPGAGEFDLALGTGYDFEIGNFSWGPFTTMQYTYIGVQGFNETGAGALNLDVDPYNSSSLLYTLGAQAAYNVKLSKTVTITPTVFAGWQHEFLQNGYGINSSFNTGGPASPFTYNTSTPARDNFYGGAGLTVGIGERWQATGIYSAFIGTQDVNSQNIYLGLGYKF